MCGVMLWNLGPLFKAPNFICFYGKRKIEFYCCYSDLVEWCC